MIRFDRFDYPEGHVARPPGSYRKKQNQCLVGHNAPSSQVGSRWATRDATVFP